MTVLVTAANGSVGRLLVPLLAERGIQIRAFDRSRPTDPQLAGVDAVFLACPNVGDQVAYECGLIDGTARAGVTRLVKLSARGAAIDSPVGFWDGHAWIEQHLAESGIEAVVLRPGFSMANLLARLEVVRNTGMLPLPGGNARVAMIDPADVAAAASIALTGEVTVGTYELTGPSAIGFAEVAAGLTAAVGRDVSYVDVPPAQAVAAMTAGGLPEVVAHQIGAVFAALRDGAQAETTDDLERLTGRPGGGLTGYLRRTVGLAA